MPSRTTLARTSCMVLRAAGCCSRRACPRERSSRRLFSLERYATERKRRRGGVGLRTFATLHSATFQFGDIVGHPTTHTTPLAERGRPYIPIHTAGPLVSSVAVRTAEANRDARGL